MNIIEAYKVLGIHQLMSDEDVKSVYRALCMKHHPDRPGANMEEFKLIQQAYAELKGVAPRTRIERMKILGLECPVCRGRGVKTKQKGWQNLNVGPCDNCGGAGYTIPDRGAKQ